MFTGIVEELGAVKAVDGSVFRFGSEVVLSDVQMGASIAVNGCCLTVVAFDQDEGWWEADVSRETFDRTSLGALLPGDRINLERPVRLADRLGGHLVQGHVDAVGQVVARAPDLVVSIPENLARYVVEKGSITIDGVSLTVVDADSDRVSVALIPHTCDVTTLGGRIEGDPVNIEVDVNAKHIERLIAAHLDAIERPNGAV